MITEVYKDNYLVIINGRCIIKKFWASLVVIISLLLKILPTPFERT